jgi:choloylglycine hydrolase
VITSAWDIATTDGINEKGLVANVLWLVESQYPKFNPKGKSKGVTIAAWAQYVLDNFATVKEAVDELKKRNSLLFLILFREHEIYNFTFIYFRCYRR